MSHTYTALDPRLEKQLHGDIAQLTRPIHMAVQRRIVRHPPLLDQLAAAAIPGNTHHTRPERRRIPDSRPPLALAPIDALITISAELDQWRHRLTLRPASTKATLAQLPATATQLAPAIAEWLTLDVHNWWHTAATQSGWRPDQLLRLR
jgi:hypothetical protein